MTEAEQRVESTEAPPSPEQPDLSILIVSYNTLGPLEDCLHSIFRNRAGVDVQVIVVDNASADGSADMVAERFPGVVLHASQQNLGFAAANNVGLESAVGRHVMLLNPDTIVHRDCLRQLLTYLEEHDDVGAVAPKLLNTDGSLQRSVRRFPTASALLYQYTMFRLWIPWRKRHASYKMRDFAFDQITDVEVPMGAAILVRGELFRGLEGLDAGYFIYYEEAHLCRQLHAAGWRVVYLPSAQASHLGGESSRQAGDFLFRVTMESLVRYVSFDLAGWRFFWFRMALKFGLVAKLLTDLPLQMFYVLRERYLRENERKLEAKSFELRRSLSFFRSDLGWLVFQLGRGLPDRSPQPTIPSPDELRKPSDEAGSDEAGNLEA